MLVKYLHFVKSKLEGMAHTIHLSPLKILQQNDLFQKLNPLLKNFCTAVWNSSWWEGRHFDWWQIYQTKTHYIVTVLHFHCEQLVFKEGGQHTTSLWLYYETKCWKRPREKRMHISSSPASVSEFDASKLVVYRKSMSFEILICFETLSHQFTM